MTEQTLLFDPFEGSFENRDSNSAIIQNGSLILAAIEENLIHERRSNIFLFQSIRACFDFCNIEFADGLEIVIPGDLEFRLKTVLHLLKRELRTHETFVGTRFNI